MSARPPSSLSRIPGFDPRRVPVEPSNGADTAVPPDRLEPRAIRQRFAHPPAWQPEFGADSFFTHEGEPRPAAVLVPIVLHPAGGTIVLTERTAHLRSHAGQVAFPGGRLDPDDASAVDGALREAHEEIGLPAHRVEVLGVLPDYLTATGYRVTPVVGLVEPPLHLSPQPQEVAAVFEVPLAFLMDPSHHRRHRHPMGHTERVFYSMPWQSQPLGREFFIWGATAAMLRNLYRFFCT
jgi:8-oxo-dGTP pyrophosphatase MutT (NUDIX family)